MALPKLDSPTYETELPSTNEKVKYRPFLVKEQKLLLIAQESKKQKETYLTMSNLLKSCTFDKLDVDNLPIFDVEYLFLKIRSKSVGEKITIMITCPDDNETKVPVKLDLKDVAVQMTVGHTNELDISDKIKMIMKYPVLGDVSRSTGSDSNKAFDIMNQCVHEVHDGDTIYKKIDMSEKDIQDFVDSFSLSQFELVTEFFSSMPKLRHTVKVINPKTKVKSEITLEGLDSFLG